MANQKQQEHQQQLNLDTFSAGIKGKVLEAVSISNELECHYISVEFEDKTETDDYAGHPPDRKTGAVRLQDRGS